MKLGPRFQLGEGPSRGLLRDCTTSPITGFTAQYLTVVPKFRGVSTADTDGVHASDNVDSGPTLLCLAACARGEHSDVCASPVGG